MVSHTHTRYLHPRDLEIIPGGLSAKGSSNYLPADGFLGYAFLYFQMFVTNTYLFINKDKHCSSSLPAGRRRAAPQDTPGPRERAAWQVVAAQRTVGCEGWAPSPRPVAWFLRFLCRISLKGHCAHWAKEPCPWASSGGPVWSVGTPCASPRAALTRGRWGIFPSQRRRLLGGETSRPWRGVGRPGPLLSCRACPTHHGPGGWWPP